MLSRLVCFSLVGLALSASRGYAQQPAPAFKTSPPTAPTTPSTNAAPVKPLPPFVISAQMVKEAMIRMEANDADGALAKLNDAIKTYPKTPTAYVLRASIYSQRKQWAEAEQDFRTASQMDPTNIVLKLNVVEIKFMQKQFDQARAGFSTFEGDPEMGDLAKYKVFLCDLFGGHDAIATKELAIFNDIGSNPSYYYSNAAWDLYHKKTDDARDWLKSASKIYSTQKNDYYAQPLKNLGYLPLPVVPPEIGL